MFFDIMIELGDSTYALITDHLGSVKMVVNIATGSVKQRLDGVYPAKGGDEYGNVVLNTNPDWQPFGYAGGLYDDATKLVRSAFGRQVWCKRLHHYCWKMLERSGNPATRETSKDPIGFGSGTSNLYEYCANDPINFIDPTGLKLWYCSKKAEKEFEDDIQRIMGSKKGRELLKRLQGDKNIFYINLVSNNNAQQRKNNVYIDPNYHPFINTDKGDRRASTTSILAHELGHLTGTKDNGSDSMNNVNRWENPIMSPIDGLNRTSYYYIKTFFPIQIKVKRK